MSVSESGSLVSGSFVSESFVSEIILRQSCNIIDKNDRIDQNRPKSTRTNKNRKDQAKWTKIVKNCQKSTESKS